MAFEEGCDLLPFLASPDEHAEGQGEGGTASRDPGRVKGRVVLEHGALEVAQLGSGQNAQLLTEDLADRLVGGERVGLASAPVEGDHQVRPQSLPERVAAPRGSRVRRPRRRAGRRRGRPRSCASSASRRSCSSRRAESRTKFTSMPAMAGPRHSDRASDSVAAARCGSARRWRRPCDRSRSKRNASTCSRADVEHVTAQAGSRFRLPQRPVRAPGRALAGARRPTRARWSLQSRALCHPTGNRPADRRAAASPGEAGGQRGGRAVEVARGAGSAFADQPPRSDPGSGSPPCRLLVCLLS